MFKRQKPDTAPQFNAIEIPSATLPLDSKAPSAQAGVGSAMPIASGSTHRVGDVLAPRSPVLQDMAPQTASAAARPRTMPLTGARPAQALAQTAMTEDAPRRTLVVGRGISVQGTVQDAERLVVEGTVEANRIYATEVSITSGGVFKGGLEVEDAEIAGTMDGTLTVRGNLIVRATGKVFGTTHCRRLQVEEGGQINGTIEMLTDDIKSEGMRSVLEPVE